MSIETLHLKTEMENVKRLVSVLDCKLYFKNWLCDHDPIRTLDIHYPIYDKNNYVGHVDRVAFLRGIVARNTQILHNNDNYSRTAWPLKMGPISCSETSVTKKPTLR
jgi:hypothetical protein